MANFKVTKDIPWTAGDLLGLNICKALMFHSSFSFRILKYDPLFCIPGKCNKNIHRSFSSPNKEQQ